MTDEEIIALYQKRQESAIRETAAQYGAFCFRLADHILKNREDSEECVNDAWLHAWNAIPPAHPKSLRMFLAKITRNLSINRYRSRHAAKRGGGETEVVLEELAECVAGSADVEETVLAKELGESISRFAYGLPERDGNVLIRRYFFTESISEIAKEYGLTENHVAVILSRVRKALKAHLEREGYL